MIILIILIFLLFLLFIFSLFSYLENKRRFEKVDCMDFPKYAVKLIKKKRK